MQDALTQLRKHLTAQVTLPQREGDFDMDDAPEAQVLSPFAELQTALLWLGGTVAQPWHDADQKALTSQSHHRLLARIAIFTGAAAIVLAVLQLSIKLTLLLKPTLPPRFATVATVLEALAVIAAVIAVGVGLGAKFDRRWFGQRHLAERLRMLKFRALEQLWCQDPPSWQQWVEGQLTELRGADDFKQVEEWAHGGEVEPDPLATARRELDSNYARALTIYYHSKRLEFQAAYFKRRQQAFERQTGSWRHLSLPLFLASVICVLAHFALELRADQLREAKFEELAGWWEAAATWFVTLAAVIPVVGVGIRAWFAAFELPRSASLFAAKHRALLHAAKHLEEDSGNADATLRHMSQAEHFLEHEHREWLRLLSDTEWFL